MAKGWDEWGKRRLNKVTWSPNHGKAGGYFLFGSTGSGKSRVIVTLGYRKSKGGLTKALRKYRAYVGRLMNDVPCE